MTDREAFEAWYEGEAYPLEHSNWFRRDASGEYEIDDVYASWRTWHTTTKLERSKAPAWKDAPTVPGLWMSRLNGTLRNLDVHDIHHLAKYGHSGKWYGPIPSEDKP